MRINKVKMQVKQNLFLRELIIRDDELCCQHNYAPKKH